MKFEWEEISKMTFRAKVHGGWVILHQNYRDNSSGIYKCESMVFVYDPIHRWELKDE